MGRSMLHHAGIPSQFSAEAVSTAESLQNVTDLQERYWPSPEESFIDKKSDVHQLRISGCRIWMHVPLRKKVCYKERSEILLNRLSHRKYRVGNILMEAGVHYAVCSHQVHGVPCYRYNGNRIQWRYWIDWVSHRVIRAGACDKKLELMPESGFISARKISVSYSKENNVIRDTTAREIRWRRSSWRGDARVSDSENVRERASITPTRSSAYETLWSSGKVTPERS